jgi:DNA primase
MSLEDLKTLIKETPISSIVGQFIPLKQNGHYHSGLCPFHPDKNPSLTVNDEKQMFMCFACDTGGDVITFVQKLKQIDFIESLREISSLLNLDFNNFYKEKNSSPRLKSAKKLLEAVNKIYGQIGENASSPALKNFLRERKLSKEDCQKFQIGYSQKTSTIKSYIETFKDQSQKKFLIDLALEIGLIKKDKKKINEYYDSFRERIIFPIWDQFGFIQGFTSRSINNFQKPKYLNSPSSLIFDKKNLLYPLHLAKSSIKKEGFLIICEGNMDAIALHKNGFCNSVAIMGTALGDRSLQNLKNITQKIFLCLDNDTAGHKAMGKINQEFLKIMIVPKFIDISPYKDPDELLSKEGPKTFNERIHQARPFIDILIENLLNEKIAKTFEQKLEILNEVFQVLSPLGTSLSAIERIASATIDLNLKSDPLQVEKSYKAYLAKKGKSSLSAPSFSMKQQKRITNEKKGLQKPKDIKRAQKINVSRSERLFIKGIVQRPELFFHNDFSEVLDLVVNTEVQRYISRLKNLIFEIEDTEYHHFVENLMSGGDFPLEIKEIAGAALYQLSPKEIEDKVKNRLFASIKIELRKDSLKNEKKSLLGKLKEPSTEGGPKNIMNKLYNIEQNLQKLKSQKFQSQ